MTVEEQRKFITEKVKAKRQIEWQIILDGRPRLPGMQCLKCSSPVVGMMATMREPPFWRRCSLASCDWSEEIEP